MTETRMTRGDLGAEGFELAAFGSEIKAHEIHHGKGLVAHLSLAVALSTIQLTVRFGSVPPQFRESEASTNFTRGYAARWLFRVPSCR
ncbi:hypothetical protein TNCV_5109581 [Trichonephila clavipes]|nr:hypothetical protein TNCV_5109581 [Trichonephila clavipes]